MPARLRTRLRSGLVVALLVVTTLAAACSGGDDGDDGGDASDDGPGVSTTASDVSGLTVGQALGVGPSEVHVRGFLVAEEGIPVRLCNSLVGDAPPQCGGPFLEVQNLDLAAVANVETAPGPGGPPVRFVREEIVLLGIVQQGVISVTRQPS